MLVGVGVGVVVICFLIYFLFPWIARVLLFVLIFPLDSTNSSGSNIFSCLFYPIYLLSSAFVNTVAYVFQSVYNFANNSFDNVFKSSDSSLPEDVNALVEVEVEEPRPEESLPNVNQSGNNTTPNNHNCRIGGR